MSRRNRRDRSSQPAQVVVASSAPGVPACEPRQPFVVRIENLMQQALEVSVLDEAGQPTGVRVGPRGKSHPISMDRVGQRTHELASAGRVRIVPHS